MTNQQRAASYASTFPAFPPLRADDRWIDGVWMLGNNYKGSGFYGAYPPGYVSRVMALFPDAERVLHLFAGSLPPSPNYARFGNVLQARSALGNVVVGAKPIGGLVGDKNSLDREGDAHELSRYYERGQFDLILADPPYSQDDADRYGTKMINRSKVLAECAEVIEPGGHLVWLDTVWPMFSKARWHCFGQIGVVRSTNHRVRLVSLFRRNPLPEGEVTS